MRDLLEKLDSISTPVNEQASVNINMNAETPNEVAELMQIMSNAGLSPSIVQTAKMDDPKIPGKDDVEGDQDLNAGLVRQNRRNNTWNTWAEQHLLAHIGAIAGGMAGGEIGDRTYRRRYNIIIIN